jgi:hypothetical protein
MTRIHPFHWICLIAAVIAGYHGQTIEAALLCVAASIAIRD